MLGYDRGMRGGYRVAKLYYEVDSSPNLRILSCLFGQFRGAG